MRMPLLSLVIVLLDQLAKQLVLRLLPLPIWLIPDDIGLQVSLNPGVAFSIPIQGMLAMILSLAIVIILVVYYRSFPKVNFLMDVIFGLIIGGALGNLADRVFYNAVVDYIRIYSYPSFNLADVAITLGFLLFILCFDRMTSKRLSLF